MNSLLQTRVIEGKEYVDFELSDAFAMCDHQIAHIFIKPGFEEKVTSIFEKQPIAKILNKELQNELQIDNERSGDIILVSQINSWFNYHWWTDEKYAPDFTFSVDIHRKPGYDPLELFFDMTTKKISHDTSLIKGSHGVIDEQVNKLPVIGSTILKNRLPEKIDMTNISSIILDFFGV